MQKRRTHKELEDIVETWTWAIVIITLLAVIMFILAANDII